MNNEQLGKAIKSAMHRAADTQSDFELNLRAIKGPEYTNLVKSIAAVMSSSGLMAKSMCTGIPLEIREILATRFGTHINIMIDCIISRYWPDMERRKLEHTEFIRNCMVFVNSNSKLEEEVQQAVLAKLTDHARDDDAMDNNGDNS